MAGTRSSQRLAQGSKSPSEQEQGTKRKQPTETDKAPPANEEESSKKQKTIEDTDFLYETSF